MIHVFRSPAAYGVKANAMVLALPHGANGCKLVALLLLQTAAQQSNIFERYRLPGSLQWLHYKTPAHPQLSLLDAPTTLSAHFIARYLACCQLLPTALPSLPRPDARERHRAQLLHPRPHTAVVPAPRPHHLSYLVAPRSAPSRTCLHCSASRRSSPPLRQSARPGPHPAFLAHSSATPCTLARQALPAALVRLYACPRRHVRQGGTQIWLRP